MKAATANEIKQKLKDLDAAELREICHRLVRFKLDNKELVTYLLFEADDPDLYITHVKEALSEMFEDVNVAHPYFAKKTIRKILRHARRYIRYAATKNAEAEILLFFLTRFNELKLPLKKYPVLQQVQTGQLKKLNLAVDALHEDLQYDFRRRMKEL